MRHEQVIGTTHASRLLTGALAVFLVLVAATQLATWWVVSSLEREFTQRLDHHLSDDVEHVRHRVTETERSLDRAAQRIAIRLKALPANAPRGALFTAIAREVS